MMHESMENPPAQMSAFHLAEPEQLTGGQKLEDGQVYVVRQKALAIDCTKDEQNMEFAGLSDAGTVDKLLEKEEFLFMV